MKKSRDKMRPTQSQRPTSIQITFSSLYQIEMLKQTNNKTGAKDRQLTEDVTNATPTVCINSSHSSSRYQDEMLKRTTTTTTTTALKDAQVPRKEHVNSLEPIHLSCRIQNSTDSELPEPQEQTASKIANEPRKERQACLMAEIYIGLGPTMTS
ncbi:hypothetical protein WAI453_013221 [Rhynchosporium graminicola]